jgi:dCTP deaminase
MNETQLPGILSDRQIRELCLPPTFIIHERLSRVREPSDTAFNSMVPLTKRSSPTYMSEEKIRSQLVRDSYDEPGIYAYTPLTNKEKAEFKPMISPFVPEQVRVQERAATIDEHQLFHLLTYQGASAEFLLTSMQKKWPAIKGVRRDAILGVMVLEKAISWGLTSYGYDVRCGDEFKIFTDVNSTVIDPKNFDEKNFVPFKGDVCIIPPNSFVLARTLEYFDLPRNIVADCVGKSTYARCGISIMVTPLEPEWDGYLTLEFANTTPLPAKIYAGEGCGQIRFFRGSEPCEVSYRDRGGKYNGQGAEPTTPKV